MGFRVSGLEVCAQGPHLPRPPASTKPPALASTLYALVPPGPRPPATTPRPSPPLRSHPPSRAPPPFRPRPHPRPSRAPPGPLALELRPGEPAASAPSPDASTRGWAGRAHPAWAPARRGRPRAARPAAARPGCPGCPPLPSPSPVRTGRSFKAPVGLWSGRERRGGPPGTSAAEGGGAVEADQGGQGS